MNDQAKARMRNWSAAVAVASAVIGAGAAFASDAPPLVKKLSPDQVQMRLHERKAEDGIQVAQLFGESDEEKAARQQHEDSQDARISELSRKVNDLEDSLQRMTGEVEELGHRLDVANQHMSQMQKDFDYKICTLAAQQLGAGTAGGDDGLPCGGQTSSSAAAEQPAAANANGPIHLSPPPGVLGTLPANAVPKNQMANAAPPPADTRKKFDGAMNLLARAQYSEAAAAFRSFADTYPDDDLASQAVYWVGDIAYVQKDYQNAAQAFVEELKKYPKSGRAPDSMLKLGQSLIAMDQKKEGCTTLGALASKYPSAKTEIEQARAARKGVCR